MFHSRNEIHLRGVQKYTMLVSRRGCLNNTIIHRYHTRLSYISYKIHLIEKLTGVFYKFNSERCIHVFFHFRPLFWSITGNYRVSQKCLDGTVGSAIRLTALS